MLFYFAGVAAAAAALLTVAAAQPHATAAASEESGPASTATLAPGQSATAKFPAATVSGYRVIVQDTLNLVEKNDQAGATKRIKDLETAWDADQSTLEPADASGWAVIDGQIDAVLTSIRSTSPDASTEKQALSTLLETLK